MLSEVERTKRLRAVTSSEGSLAMEGQILDATTRHLNQKFTNGELTFEQFSNAIDEHVEKLAQSLREQALAVSA